MLCHEGKLSAYCFFGTVLLILTLSLSEYIFDFVPNIWGALLWGPLLYYIVINISLRMFFKELDYQVGNFFFVLLIHTILILLRLLYVQHFWGSFLRSVFYLQYLAHYVGNHLEPTEQ